jgi:hypothetical protein
MAEKQIIPILTLSGGVSRQPASKRTPFQAENLDNCLVSLERSVEKRPGFSILSGVGTYDLSFLPTTVDPHFTWYQLDRDNRYLIIIDRNAIQATSTLFYVMKITDVGWTNQTPEAQWDPQDPELTWNGLDSITNTDARYPIYTLSLNVLSGTPLQKYTTVLNTGLINRDTRTYITHGSGKPKEVLKALQLGTNIVYLNTKVYAGFTSGTSGKIVGLDGKETGATDLIGNKVTYYSAVRVKKTTDGRLYPNNHTLRDGESWDVGFPQQFIPVEDYVYGDFEKPWLGQSVENFGEIRFPPDNNDWIVLNERLAETTPIAIPADTSARDMLKLLYDADTPYYNPTAAPTPIPDGRGKIYYCDAPYLSLDAGYYRIVSFPEDQVESGVTGKGKPYTQKVRTPDHSSVIDKKRMPQKLTFLNGVFKFEPINWTPRTVGDRVTNPGPSPFLTPEGEARHVQITALCNFRDRLFFASGDIVFSSQMGVLEDLWIKDPSNVTVSDPIDVRAASNSYAEITAMVPFNQYLFINTKGGVQFELKGDSNLISPLTAEISSTTFYSTADLVDPLTLGSQIYFLDKERLYIYLNQDSREFNTAIELSNTVRGYLPKNYKDVTTAVAQNYILAVDEDNKNTIYIYCNRFDGGQLIQSAFWRYILSNDDEIFSIKVWDNYLYGFVKRGGVWYLMSSLLEQEETNIPKLDSRTKLLLMSSNVTSSGLTTTVTIPYLLPQEDEAYVVLTDDFGDIKDSVFKILETTRLGNTTSFVISGINLSNHLLKNIYVGSAYRMSIELSPIYLRGEGNNIIEGTVNLKTLTVRHHKTGNYSVQVTRRGRQNKLVSEFSATNLETNPILAVDGTFTAKVFGFADETQIEIINDSVTPCNITQLEFKTVFNKNNSSLR